MAFKFSYIGHPLSGLGFALIGARQFSPEPDRAAVLQALDTARRDSELVLIENEYAELIAEHLRETVLTQPEPPIAVVPCLHEDDELSDLSIREARVVLGIG